LAFKALIAAIVIPATIDIIVEIMLPL